MRRLQQGWCIRAAALVGAAMHVKATVVDANEDLGGTITAERRLSSAPFAWSNVPPQRTHRRRIEPALFPSARNDRASYRTSVNKLRSIRRHFLTDTSCARAMIAMPSLLRVATGPEGAMFQLVYSSRATQEFTPPKLKLVLINARLRNREVGVTGILVYHAGLFLQALEGDEAPVRAIFARIEKDRRHGDISVLRSDTTPGKRRIFGEWSMGFADANGSALVLKGFIDVKKDPGLTALDARRAMDILEAFRHGSLRLSA